LSTKRKFARRWVVAGAIAATLSPPAGAQIQVLNPFGMRLPFIQPFGSRQNTVSPNSTTGYSPLPVQSNGLTAKYLTWNGHQWSNDSGQTWNTNVPYAIQTTAPKIRFEAHDTTLDRGQFDESTKRRSEISSTKEFFLNHTGYWMAFSFKVHWNCMACQVNLKQGGEIMQVHWPSGDSPPLAFRVVPYKGAAGFSVTTHGVNQGNISRYVGPLTLDTVHDVVFHFQLGATGYEQVWLDGVQVSNVSNIPVGTDLENGYAMRLGPYYGGGLNGNVVVQEYGNVAPFPSTSSLSARISSPPAW